MSRKRQALVSVAGRGQVRTLAWDYRAGERLPPHRHGWHQLVYATSGVMTVTTPAGTWVVPTNRAVWILAYVEHAIEMSGRVSMRTLYLSPRLNTPLERECGVVSVTPLLRELLLRAVALGGLERRVPTERRLLDVLLDQLRELRADALHLPFPRDPRALRVAERLAASPGDSVPLGRVARDAGASKRTLERIFYRETAMTLGRWRQQLRLAQALRLLGAGEPVTTCALEVGYESPSAFVQVFRRTFGVTPRRYFEQPHR
jgi:AraC-like DNA-binding protein/quercetin dioxygenase-like cupin family protein